MKKIIACLLILLCLASCSKDEIITTEFDLMLPNFTMIELMNETSLVIRAKCSGEKESFRVKEVNSDGQKTLPISRLNVRKCFTVGILSVKKSLYV